MSTKPSITGVAFDVFGTTADWFSSIIQTGLTISPQLDWADFAVKWVAGYRTRVDEVRLGKRAWAPLDVLLNETFVELSIQFDLSKYDPEKIVQLSDIWHNLFYWPDAVPAIKELQKRFRVGALSNANTALLIDIGKSVGLLWDCIISAEMVKKYKPEVDIYLLAGSSLGPSIDQVLYVASHKWDLDVARKLGMQTAFVSRPCELGGFIPSAENGPPESSVDYSATDFGDLALKLMGSAEGLKRFSCSTSFEHVEYQKYVHLHVSSISNITPNCPEPVPKTDDNIEGPYYRPEAPWKGDLANNEEAGRKLLVSGCVADRCGNRIDGAVLDIWQANSCGHYDNDGSFPTNQPSPYRLRGKIKTDSHGEYAFKTIWPGEYNIGGGVWRPSHIHVKIYAPGFKKLTTQLYFKGDPFNKGDFAYLPTLEMDPVLEGGVYKAKFNFHLEQDVEALRLAKVATG